MNILKVYYISSMFMETFTMISMHMIMLERGYEMLNMEFQGHRAIIIGICSSSFTS